MLLKSKIAKFAPYSDEWFSSRIGRFTGSKMGTFLLEKGFDKGAINYIRKKIGEKHNNKLSDKNITNEAITFGVDNEPKAALYFKEKNNIEFLVNQCAIIHNDYFSVTPDGLIVKKESLDQLSYFVETLEIKCLPTYERHIELLECETPLALKKVDPMKYWQVISQMEWCGAIRGHFFAFNQEFEEPLRSGHIIFNKIDLLTDFKLFNERCKMIVTEFETRYDNLINKKKAA